MTRESGPPPVAEWDRLASTCSEGRKQRTAELCRLAAQLGAIAETLESHIRAEDEEDKVEHECARLLRESLQSSAEELERARGELAVQASRADAAQERERSLTAQVEDGRIVQELADEKAASLERDVAGARAELDQARRELAAVRGELRKAQLECAEAAAEAGRSLEAVTETCIENTALQNELIALRQQYAERESELASARRAAGEAIDENASLRSGHEAALAELRIDHLAQLGAKQNDVESARAEAEAALRERDDAAARLAELQRALEEAHELADRHESEIEELCASHQEELEKVRFNRDEERAANAKKGQEAKATLDRAWMRAHAAVNEVQVLRGEHEEEVRGLRQRLEEVEAQLSRLRASGAAQQVEPPVRAPTPAVQQEPVSNSEPAPAAPVAPKTDTESSAPPRKAVRRKTVRPKTASSPGGYSMTEVEIRDEVGPRETDGARRRRKP